MQDGSLLDVGIDDGYIVTLEPEQTGPAARQLDAAGRLLLPAFVNAQLHACKVFWRRPLAALPAEVASLPRFAAARYVKQGYTEADVTARVDEVVRLALLHGTCALRLFADVDEDSGLRALRGLLALRERYRAVMKLEIVAFPQDGLGSPQRTALLREALELGADVVGGIPWTEPTAAAQEAHTDLCLRLAREFGKDLHLVCDDTLDPASRTLAYLAQRTVAEGWQGRVAATQCAALAFYDAYAREVIGLVKAAGITVFSNTQVSLVTGGGGAEPQPRGTTRIRELLAAGVPVACAQDDIDNWYYPFGKNDLLEVAQFMAHTGPFAWDGATEQIVPMVTAVPAAVMHLPDYGLYPGAAANLTLLDAPDWHRALQFQAAKTAVIVGGRVLAESRLEQHLQLP